MYLQQAFTFVKYLPLDPTRLGLDSCPILLLLLLLLLIV